MGFCLAGGRRFVTLRRDNGDPPVGDNLELAGRENGENGGMPALGKCMC